MKCDVKTKNRLKRLNGQMAGVLKMMEEERSCEEIVMQLSAIRAGIDRAISVIATNNLVGTIESEYDIDLNSVQEAIDLLIKVK